jgi:hypothetical protein
MRYEEKSSAVDRGSLHGAKDFSFAQRSYPPMLYRNDIEGFFTAGFSRDREWVYI